jgi:hypothetical protein
MATMTAGLLLFVVTFYAIALTHLMGSYRRAFNRCLAEARERRY